MSENDVQINLRATDNATPVVDAATKNILANWKVMRQEVRATTGEFQLQNQTLVAGANVFRAFGAVAGSMMNIFTQYETMQIRVTDANNSLILAQLHYNQVLAMEGPGTNDAIAASIQLQEAKTNVAQATQQETLGYIGMAFELGTTVSLMIGAIPKIKQFVKELQGAQAAQSALNLSPTGGLGGVGTGVGGGGKGSLLAKGLGVAGGLGLGAAGILSGGEQQTTEQKLLSIGETAGGGALLGLSVGGPIGALIGAGAGAGVGIAQNYGQEIEDYFSKLFAGNQQSNQNGKVEHVVTIKIENASDHKVSATEQSMGIEQVMGSGQ